MLKICFEGALLGAFVAAKLREPSGFPGLLRRVWLFVSRDGSVAVPECLCAFEEHLVLGVVLRGDWVDGEGGLYGAVAVLQAVVGDVWEVVLGGPFVEDGWGCAKGSGPVDGCATTDTTSSE
jgi:hypothetical protein